MVETEDTVGIMLEDPLSVVNPLDVSYSLLIALPAVSFTPVVTLVKYVVKTTRLSYGSSVNVLFELELAGDEEDILTQVLKLSEDTLKVPEQEVLSVLVVTWVVPIASENVTMMLSVIDTELWLSAVVETEDTVGAVVSGILLELSVLEVLLSSSIPSSFEDEAIQPTIPIINQNNTNTILLCVIFFTDKDMITLNNPSITNIINHLGIIEKS